LIGGVLAKRRPTLFILVGLALRAGRGAHGVTRPTGVN
jgi:hypothetical protein